MAKLCNLSNVLMDWKASPGSFDIQLPLCLIAIAWNDPGTATASDRIPRTERGGKKSVIFE